MTQTWIAFIVACNLNVCEGQKIYTKEFAYSEPLCLDKARNWAILMKVNYNKEYAYGCEKNTYEPKRLDK